MTGTPHTSALVHYSLSYDPKLSGISLTENVTKSQNSIDVETIDLDGAFGRENRIDSLLIDAEGYELNILKGATNILRKHSPKIIIEIARNNFDKGSEMLINESYTIEQVYNIVFYCTKQYKVFLSSKEILSLFCM